MAKKKTIKKIECKNIVSTDGLTVIVEPKCPHKVAVGNKFITTSARCEKCNSRKEPTTAEISSETTADGVFSKEE